MSKKHAIADRQKEIFAGVALVVAGSWLLYDAYERRGKQRPFATRLLPGP